MKYIIMIALCCPLILNAETKENANADNELNLSDNHQSFYYGRYPFYPLSYRGLYYPYYSYDHYGHYYHSFCPHCSSYSCPMMKDKHKMMKVEHKVLPKDDVKDVE